MLSVLWDLEFNIWQFGNQYLPVCCLFFGICNSIFGNSEFNISLLALSVRMACNLSPDWRGLQELASIYQYIDDISIMRKVEPIYHHYQPPAFSAVRSQYGGQPINQLRASRCSIIIVFAYNTCICVFVLLCQLSLNVSCQKSGIFLG